MTKITVYIRVKSIPQCFANCFQKIGEGPETLAHLVMLGYVPQLESGNKSRCCFYSELFDVSASLDELIMDSVSFEKFKM